MGIRLLTRTTRNLAPTQPDEQLADTLGPAFKEIIARFDSISALRQKPAGTICLTTSKHAAERILLPVATRLMADYPDLNIEISVEKRLIDPD